mgnify:CR=1 FL=1
MELHQLEYFVAVAEDKRMLDRKPGYVTGTSCLTGSGRLIRIYLTETSWNTPSSTEQNSPAVMDSEPDSLLALSQSGT